MRKGQGAQTQGMRPGRAGGMSHSCRGAPAEPPWAERTGKSRQVTGNGARPRTQGHEMRMASVRPEAALPTPSPSSGQKCVKPCEE